MALLLQTTLELGLITSLVVLALYLSYSMLNICDLSTDGCFTLGACVGGVVASLGYPYLSIPLAVLAGTCSGIITGLLQTTLGINSLLAGIIVNTGLYSMNIAIMGNRTLVNLNQTETIFTKVKDLLNDSFLQGKQALLIALGFVFLVILFYHVFLKTRLGLALRATGDNPTMVKSSSINPTFTTLVGLGISSSITALGGCLFAQSQKSVNIDIGTGILTIALASLLIGRTLKKNGSITTKAFFAVVGSILFRLIYTLALRMNMPAYMLKLVSAIIVAIALALPYLQTRYLLYQRQHGGKVC